MYDDIMFEVKSAKGSLKILVHIEKKIENQMAVALKLVQQLEKACVATYLKWTGNMGVDCFHINKECIVLLANAKRNYGFNNYNHLWIESLGKSLGGTHSMVKLVQENYHIGVDVAAEQYRKAENKKDNVAAEITIASSSDQLSLMLHARHQIDPKYKWQYMPVEKKPDILKALQTYYPDLQQATESKPTATQAATPPPVVEVKPSHSRCVIL